MINSKEIWWFFINLHVSIANEKNVNAINKNIICVIIIGINTILLNGFLTKLYAQDFVPEMHHDSVIQYKEIIAGVEVKDKGYAFLGVGLTFDKRAVRYVFTIDDKGKVINKNIFVEQYKEDDYHLLNIHYVNPGYIITGVYSRFDSGTYNTISDHLMIFKLDDNLNLLNQDSQIISAFSFPVPAQYLPVKSRITGNKILANLGDLGLPNTYALIDTSGKIITINKDTTSPPTFDIAKNDSGYIAIIGKTSEGSCYVYLDDSLKVTGISNVNWYMPGDDSPPVVFNNQGLYNNQNSPSIKRLSSGTLLQGGDCDSMGATGLGIRKTLFAFIKTDNEGNILLKKGFTPTGWSSFAQDGSTVNNFDFVDPDNIYLGVKAGARFFVVNLDSNLNERWRRMISYPDINYGLVYGHSMFATSDGGCMLLGTIGRSDTAYRYDGFIVKLNRNGSINSNNEIVLHESELFVYPNPSSDKIFITGDALNKTFILFDLQGRNMINEEKLNTGIDVSNLKAGIYFYQITDKNTGAIKTGKWIKYD